MGADVDPLRRYSPGQFMFHIVDLFGPPSGIAPQGEIVSWEAKVLTTPWVLDTVLTCVHLLLGLFLFKQMRKHNK